MGVVASYINEWHDPREDIIIVCVRWYLCYSLSYSQLEQMMLKRGLSMEASMFYRLVQDYSNICKQHQYSRKSSNSWRVVQTFVNLQGDWKFLYRAVDEVGNTLDFILLSSSNQAEAKNFFAQVFHESDYHLPQFLQVAKREPEKYKHKKSHWFNQRMEGKFKLKLSLGMLSCLLFFLGSTYGLNWFKTEKIEVVKEHSYTTAHLLPEFPDINKQLKEESQKIEESLTVKIPQNATALASLQASEKAFLDTLAWAEGTLHSDGYRTLFGGKVIHDLSKHPNICVPYRAKGRTTCSTAFGRYQILNFNGEGMSFEPAEQDKWAIAKLQQIGVLSKIHTGNIEGAIVGSCRVWSSLPCHRYDAHGYYGQPTKPMNALLAKYQERLKIYE